MINIIPTTTKKEGKIKIKSKKRARDVKENSFSESLKESVNFDFQGTIEELLDELKDQEKQFVEKQSQYELNRYKSMVQKILKMIQDKGFETIKLKPRKKQKSDFFIVKEINGKIVELTKKVTNSKNKAFNLLKEIEEIRGLILDLLY